MSTTAPTAKPTGGPPLVRRRYREFVALWLTGLIHPSRAYQELAEKPAPAWGFAAVAIRFVVTALTTTLSLVLLSRPPFTPPYLTFLAADDYYRAEVFFLPVFGIAAWLLMSATAHLGLRLLGRHPDFDHILNIVGFGMLVPMAVLWIADWLMIAADIFRLPATAIVHATVQLWEALLFAVGFHTMLGVSKRGAAALGVVIGALYPLLAAIFVR